MPKRRIRSKEKTDTTKRSRTDSSDMIKKMRDSIEEGNAFVNVTKVAEMMKVKPCADALVQLLKSENDMVSKAAMITARTALTPDTPDGEVHSVLIDLGIIETLIELMNRPLSNSKKKRKTKKVDRIAEIVNKARSGGRAAHLIGLLAYNDAKTSATIVHQNAVSSLANVLNCFHNITKLGYKMNIDLYLCAIQSVKASACAFGQIAHHGIANATAILEEERAIEKEDRDNTILNNLLKILTSKSKKKFQDMIKPRKSTSQQHRDVRSKLT